MAAKRAKKAPAVVVEPVPSEHVFRDALALRKSEYLAHVEEIARDIDRRVAEADITSTEGIKAAIDAEVERDYWVAHTEAAMVVACVSKHNGSALAYGVGTEEEGLDFAMIARLAMAEDVLDAVEQIAAGEGWSIDDLDGGS